ncbi:hypothetical protein EJ08DRAFT_65143 [Tothia fuscella]|uniref:Arrestin C-terminal-like domain-containing protein n=1 Tax=Tothia fuscella TaxID=1048955 RepID=A0A9P4NEV7_9PEZI|nr:hypothetical protein EJ08DRAFT_65143 [Tothia fuscella]
MPGAFSGARAKALSKCFEIKLDSPFVVFDGDSNEAHPTELTGTLSLTNTDSIHVRSIKIRLEGKWKVSWLVEPSQSSLSIRDKGIIIDEELMLYPTEGGSASVAHKIAPGVHEWRFKFTLDASLPESVEGLSGSFVVYDLKAEIDRGYMSKNLTAEKHVRIVRTLGRDMTETVPMPYSNEDTWKDKLWYHIYVPTRYYIFGTSITAEFILCPLNKGVKIGKIKLEVLERVQLITAEGRHNSSSKDTVVASHEQEMPENALPVSREDMEGMVDDDNLNFDESHKFRVTLPLERSLNNARQTVDTDHLKVFHNLKIYVNLHNPDGHISQLLVRNLVHIFISPNLPVGDDQMIQANAAELAQLSQTNEAGTVDAPPTYERHQLDQLYDDIDPLNFLSGANTPYHSHSRTGSNENLHASLDATTLNNTAANITLQSRLAALQEPESGWHGGRVSPPTPGIDEEFTHPSPRQSVAHLAPLARATSQRGSYHQYLSPTPPMQPQSYFPVQPPNGRYDMDALARIPSYNTAIRTPVVTPPGTSSGLPTYDIAVSTPNSPALRAATPAELRVPARAHVRAGSESSGSSGGSLRLSPPRNSIRPHSAYVRTTG